MEYVTHLALVALDQAGTGGAEGSCSFCGRLLAYRPMCSITQLIVPITHRLRVIPLICVIIAESWLY